MMGIKPCVFNVSAITIKYEPFCEKISVECEHSDGAITVECEPSGGTITVGCGGAISVECEPSFGVLDDLQQYLQDESVANVVLLKSFKHENEVIMEMINGIDPSEPCLGNWYSHFGERHTLLAGILDPLGKVCVLSHFYLAEKIY